MKNDAEKRLPHLRISFDIRLWRSIVRRTFTSGILFTKYTRFVRQNAIFEMRIRMNG